MKPVCIVAANSGLRLLVEFLPRAHGTDKEYKLSRFCDSLLLAAQIWSSDSGRDDCINGIPVLPKRSMIFNTVAINISPPGWSILGMNREDSCPWRKKRFTETRHVWFDIA